MLIRPGFVRAAPTLPGTTRIRLPSTPSTCCDRQKAKVSHLRSNQQRLTAQAVYLIDPHTRPTPSDLQHRGPHSWMGWRIASVAISTRWLFSRRRRVFRRSAAGSSERFWGLQTGVTRAGFRAPVGGPAGTTPQSGGSASQPALRCRDGGGACRQLRRGRQRSLLRVRRSDGGRGAP